nr:mitogen-activated protein kinase kinase 3 [Tanacetum cinerariifolium]
MCKISIYHPFQTVFPSILDDPSPSPPKDTFSPEFCSFIDDCLQKDADARPTAEQYENDEVDLAAFVRGIFDPTQRMKDLADARDGLRLLVGSGPQAIFGLDLALNKAIG